MTSISCDEIRCKLKNVQEVIINVRNLRSYVLKNIDNNKLGNSINELEKELIIDTFLDMNDSDEVKVDKLRSILININDLKNQTQIDSDLKDFYSYIQNILEAECNLLYQRLCEDPLYYLESDFVIEDSELGTCYSCRCIECGKVKNVPLGQLNNRLICDYENWFIRVPLKPSIPFSEVQEAFAEIKKDVSKEAVPIMIKKYVHYKKEPY